MRPLPLFLALAACQSAHDTAGIEITGYLDANRIAVTEVGAATANDTTLALFGEPGAVQDATELEIGNPRTGEESTAAVGPDGEFAASLTGRAGDSIRIGVGGIGALDLQVSPVGDFPPTVSVNPHAPDADGLVFFTMELAAAGEHSFVLAAPAGSVAAPMVASDADGLIWEGAIPGHTGDVVWLTALDRDHAATRAISLTVP